MRVARGVQNKVLEAMAMGKAVVTTPQGLEGIAATAGQHLLVAETAGDFVQATTAALDPALAKRLGEAARRRVVEAYSWPAQLQSFDRLLGL